MKSIQWSVVTTQMGAALGGIFLQTGNNLADVPSPSSARNNLGLGTAATQNTGASGASLPFLNGANTWSGVQSFNATSAFAGKVTLFASTSAGAPLNIPQGAAPTAPANGDCWTTSAGLYCQINGATQGPFSAGGGSVSTTRPLASLGVDRTSPSSPAAPRSPTATSRATAPTSSGSRGDHPCTKTNGTAFGTFATAGAVRRAPAIEGTTPAAGSFTTLGATGLITPSTTNGIKGTTAADNANAGERRRVRLVQYRAGRAPDCADEQHPREHNVGLADGWRLGLSGKRIEPSSNGSGDHARRLAAINTTPQRALPASFRPGALEFADLQQRSQAPTTACGPRALSGRTSPRPRPSS